MPPIVLEHISLASFLETLIQTPCAQATLIICFAQQDFITNCTEHIQRVRTEQDADNETNAESQDEPTRTSERKHDLCSILLPTLQRISAASRVKVIFCANLPQLLAHLSTLSTGQSVSKDIEQQAQLLAVWDLLKLHRPTTAWSVQGLNKTFAALVDAACARGARLLVAEGVERRQVDTDVDVPDTTDGSPWSEHVSMLNVTTKTFGVGESGWVGRTVPVRKIAERWFTVIKVVDTP